MYRVPVRRGIKVGGHTYKVKCDSRTATNLIDSGLYGRNVVKRKEIQVDETESETQFSQIFLHESLHAVNDVYCNSILKEAHIKQLAAGMTQVMESLNVRFVKE